MSGPMDALWNELLADALASDGPIADRDVKEAVRRNRPKIEAEARAPLRELAGYIDAEIDRLWKLAYKYDQHGEGSIGLLIDMTNAIGGWDGLRALADTAEAER